MGTDKRTQLEEMLIICKGLGVEVDFRPESSYFTAMDWKNWNLFFNEARALSIQQQIKEKTAQYPQLMCYCFDPYSTLVYAL